MHIKGIEIKDFKKFSGTHRIDFPADFTVVRGKNESGKSTLLEALYAALFYDPTIASTPQYIKNLSNWNADKLYTIKIFFEADAENYILEKDFETKKVILQKEDGDVKSHDPQEIADFLKEYGGYDNKDLFANISVIKKDVLVLLDADKRKIMESLQDMVSGAASVSVSALLKKLKTAADQMEKGLDPSRPVKNPGKIKMLQERIKDIENNVASMRDTLKTKQEAQEKLREFKDKLDKLEEEKDVLEREYKANEEYFSAKNEIEKISKQLDAVMGDIEKYEDLESEKIDLNKKIKKTKLPSEKDLDAIEERKLNIRFNADKIEELDRILGDLKEKHKKVYRPTKKIFIRGSVFLGILGLAGFVYEIFFFAWVFLLAFAAWMFFSGKYQESTGIKSLENEREKREKDLEKERKDLNKHLSSFGVDDVSELKSLNKDIHEAKNRAEGIEREQKTLLRGRSIEQLKKQNKELHKQLGVQESKIKEEYKSTPPEPKRQREIEHRLDKLKKELESTSKKYNETNAKVNMANVSQEDISAAEEKISVLQENLKTQKRRAKIYRIVHEVLEEARMRSLAKTREALEATMSEYIGEITSGRYTSLRLTDDFDIEAHSPEKKDYVSSEELSTGTIDQLYVVARFALAQLLYNSGAESEEKNEGLSSTRPLIILDDPFGNFDEERRSNMHNILERLNEDFQIIMLTCVRAYDGWGETIEIK
ncbi:MAG: AAA family ATPase [Candidatus Spechtbacterales bacterium]|nr:AAA family ATPase [Candidatus Spechtbacterales bacterium]